MNKRGQFFLVAAFIIVGIMTSITTVVNEVNIKENDEHFYDLAREIKYEAKRILDNAVYDPSNDPDKIKKKMNNFLGNYVDYLNQDNLLFVYGRPENIDSWSCLDGENPSCRCGIKESNLPPQDPENPSLVAISGIEVFYVSKGVSGSVGINTEGDFVGEPGDPDTDCVEGNGGNTICLQGYGPGDFTCQILKDNQGKAKISLTLNDEDFKNYEFNIQPGENFFFIIIKTAEGEQFVAAE